MGSTLAACRSFCWPCKPACGLGAFTSYGAPQPALSARAPPSPPRPPPPHPLHPPSPPHRYSDIEDRTEILERLLRWRHLIPTAPDTLAAYPYHDADPFILQATPHVLFAGGQPAFGTRLVQEEGGPAVRVVAVPNFSTTGCLVLVNLQTLECHPVHFDASM